VGYPAVTWRLKMMGTKFNRGVICGFLTAIACAAGCGDDGVATGSGSTGGTTADIGTTTTVSPTTTSVSGTSTTEQMSMSGTVSSGSESTGPEPTTGPGPTTSASTTDVAGETETTGDPPPVGVCGDGAVDEGEECDDGANNGPGQACLADCTSNVCGGATGAAGGVRQRGDER
jgi:hypothetical protein